MIAVTCPSGRIAAELVPRLLRRGHPVRILCRAPSRVEKLAALGAQVLPGSLFDLEHLEALLRDVRASFLVTPLGEDPGDEVRAGRGLADAHVGSPVEHVVYVSVFGADREPRAPSIAAKGRIEQHLADTGIDTTFLRPAFLMENLGLLRAELATGVLPLPVSRRAALPMVATADVALAALLALVRGPAGLERLEVAAPELVTPEEMADLLSEPAGHRIEAHEVSPADFAARLERAGTARHRAAHLAELAVHVAETAAAAVTGAAALTRLGVEPTPFAAFARRGMAVAHR